MQTSFFKKMYRPLLALLILITTLKILFVGYDIDEQYAVAMAYRMLNGDFPLLTMWEPHQTSGFLCALLMLPYLAVLKTTAGVFLYLRLMGLLLHSLVTFFLYQQFKTSFSADLSLAICCIWFFSLPKLMFLPEFSNMQLWFLMAMILCLLKYYAAPDSAQQNHYTRPSTDGKVLLPHLGLLCAAGFFLAMEVLSYPSTVFVFPVCIFFIFLYRNKGRRSVLSELTAFTAPCLLSAACFTGFLLSRMSLQELFALLPFAASDGSHSATFTQKLAANASSLLEILFFLGVYSALSGLLYLLYRIAGKLFGKRRQLQKPVRFGFCYPSLLLFSTLAGQILIWIFGERYPNYPLTEYFFLPLLGICFLPKVRKSPVFSFFVVVPLTAFAGIVVFTNHPLLVSSPFLIPCVVGILALPGFLESKTTKAPARAIVGRSVLLLWVLVLLFGKLYMVRTTGGTHYTMFDSLSIMRKGPGAGIIADRETVRRYNISYEFLQENLPAGAKVFYAGSSCGIYLMQDMEICTPSTISSPTFDEKIMQYFSMNPQKAPQYVICDADLPDLYGDTWLSAFLENYCEPQPFASNDFLLLYRVLPALGET